MNDLTRIDPCGGDYGGLILPFGKHTIEVVCPIDLVYLSIKDQDYQVCGANYSTGTAILTDYGFQLIVDIQSDSAEVNWILYRYWR